MIYVIMIFAIFIFFLLLQDNAFFVKILNFLRLDNAYHIMLFNEDDSDIKIAGDHIKHGFSPDETLIEADELQKHKQNGNLDRARELGNMLSCEVIAMDGDVFFGEDNNEDCEIRRQRRILMAFTACICVENEISDKIIQRVAINSFYNALKNDLPEFYDDLSDSGAFSFYYLCVRRGVETEKNIGKTFAMLSGKENDTVIEELGIALFYRFTDVIKKCISSVRFNDIK